MKVKPVFFIIGAVCRRRAQECIHIYFKGGSNEPPGTLTITGLPAEYNGKFISASIKSIPTKFTDEGEPLDGNKPIANAERTVIENGEARLPVYVFKMFGTPGGYIGSDTGDVEFEIYDRVETITEYNAFTPLLRAGIASVAFEGGAAEANWGNAVKGGSITFINIPETYNDTIEIQVVEEGARRIPLVKVPTFAIKNIIATGYYGMGFDHKTALVFQQRKGSGYTPFPKSLTADIVVSLLPSKEMEKVSDAVRVNENHVFLFKGVQFTDGKAALDFRRGVRQ